MLQYERFETIMNKLQKQSSVRVSDLSRELGVSESTIRRDISDLDKAGRLKKVFGGAVPKTDDTDFAGRSVNAVSRNVEEKARIQVDEKSEVAMRAASLIEDGDLVYIDAGTTTGCMIDHISCQGATFVTNGARHAIRLARRGFKVYLLSGRLKAKTEAVIGPGAVDSLHKYHFSKCFIGTDGVDRESGLTTADIEESMVKTKAIELSQDVFILADSSKFGLVASVTFAPLDAGAIITDRLPDEAYRRQARVVELHK